MIFSSIEFFLFLAGILGILALSRGETFRRRTLLFASYIFYGWWDWRFCFLILGSTVIDYFVGIHLEDETDDRRRKRWLVVSLVANLGALGIFKYANFFLESFQTLIAPTGVDIPHLHIVLPVGISFYTFQTMSYSIDVYRRRIPATRDLGDFALFVAFFPQLVAGPIVRGSEFLPQLKTVHPLRWINIVTGSEIFLRGFVKKVLFADTLAQFVDPVFASPDAYSSLSCWLAVTAYAGQIYYDFSGYSEMAIGVGRMLGFELPVNFRHPYVSTSITEFWRRWHISLSSWLRDYLYIPLGGNRNGRWRTYRNLALTMLLGGLWHGAAWTFVVWGALHGIALALHKLLMEARESGSRWALPETPKPIAWVGTFVYVLVTWVFFRSQDFETAWVFLGRMVGAGDLGLAWYHTPSLVLLSAGALIHIAVMKRNEVDLRLDLRRPEACAFAMVVLFFVLFYAPFGNSPFIYFQF